MNRLPEPYDPFSKENEIKRKLDEIKSQLARANLAKRNREIDAWCNRMREQMDKNDRQNGIKRGKRKK